MALTLKGTNNMVLQMATTVKTDPWSNYVDNTYYEITGLTVTITPARTSNKILVMASLGSVSGYSAAVKLLRNGSVISGAIGDAAGSRPQITGRATWGDGNHPNQIFINYLDSPSTTSATTYSIAGACYNGYGFCLNRSANDTNTADTYGGRSISTITAMEISA